MARFFDSHAHLDGEPMQKDMDGILQRAKDAGVTDIICIGASSGFESNLATLEVVRKHPQLYASVGVHPHDAAVVNPDMLQTLRNMAEEPWVVGIGETGLDYHYQHAPRELQDAAFRGFLRMAAELKLPAIIHTREADKDTLRILEEENADRIGGVIHCFTGTEKLAFAALDLGFYISLSGVLTFKNAGDLRDIAKKLPKDCVLVETDCPYLAPVPHRGQANEPAYVLETTRVLAELWGEDVQKTMARTGENAERCFPRTSIRKFGTTSSQTTVGFSSTKNGPGN